MKKTLLRIAIAGLVTVSSVAQTTTIEAKSGVITPPFILTNGYIFQSSETGLTNGGRVVFTFTITNAGDYVIQARVRNLESSSNSFFVSLAPMSLNAEPQDPASIWEFPPSDEFTDRDVILRGATNSPTIFNLAAGTHRVVIRGKGANAQLLRLSIVASGPGPSPPSNLRLAGP